MKVPAIIASSLICLMLGVGLGAVGAVYLGLTTERFSSAAGLTSPPEEGKGGSMPMMMPMMMKGGPGGGGPMGGGKGPSPKAQLNSLVGKLELVTGKSATVQLSDDERKNVREQLKGLDAAEELSDDDAKQRLDALLEALKDHKPTLEAVGFRWPGQQGAGFGAPKDAAPNPFKTEENAKRLQSLQDRLGKAG